MYKIGEFSELTGLSIPTLRFYDKCGLLTPEIREENGYRYYSKQQLLQSQFIINMKSVGLKIEEISGLMNNANPEEVMPILSNTRERLQEELDLISHLEEYYRMALQRGETDISIESMEMGVLAGGHFLALNVTGHDEMDIFGLDGQLLQKQRDTLGLKQKSGLRLIHDVEKETLSLVMPVETPTTAEAIEATTMYPSINTASCILDTETLNYTLEFKKMKSLLNKRGVRAEDAPVIECLLDPGDLMAIGRILVKMHAVVK